MTDAIRVQIVQRVERLPHHKSRLRFSQVLLFCDVKKELAALAKPSQSHKKIRTLYLQINLLTEYWSLAPCDDLPERQDCLLSF